MKNDIQFIQTKLQELRGLYDTIKTLEGDLTVALIQRHVGKEVGVEYYQDNFDVAIQDLPERLNDILEELGA